MTLHHGKEINNHGQPLIASGLGIAVVVTGTQAAHARVELNYVV
jgi:hypothetical protein